MVKTVEDFKDPVEDEVKGIVWNISLEANGKAYWCVKKNTKKIVISVLKVYVWE